MKKKIKRGIETIVFCCMIRFVKIWANRYMDQWEKLTFDGKFGTVYLTISKQDEYPDSFDKVK